MHEDSSLQKTMVGQLRRDSMQATNVYKSGILNVIIVPSAASDTLRAQGGSDLEHSDHSAFTVASDFSNMSRQDTGGEANLLPYHRDAPFEELGEVLAVLALHVSITLTHRLTTPFGFPGLRSNCSRCAKLPGTSNLEEGGTVLVGSTTCTHGLEIPLGLPGLFSNTSHCVLSIEGTAKVRLAGGLRAVELADGGSTTTALLAIPLGRPGLRSNDSLAVTFGDGVTRCATMT